MRCVCGCSLRSCGPAGEGSLLRPPRPNVDCLLAVCTRAPMCGCGVLGLSAFGALLAWRKVGACCSDRPSLPVQFLQLAVDLIELHISHPSSSCCGRFLGCGAWGEASLCEVIIGQPAVVAIEVQCKCIDGRSDP